MTSFFILLRHASLHAYDYAALIVPTVSDGLIFHPKLSCTTPIQALSAGVGGWCFFQAIASRQ